MYDDSPRIVKEAADRLQTHCLAGELDYDYIDVEVSNEQTRFELDLALILNEYHATHSANGKRLIRPVFMMGSGVKGLM